MAERLSKEQAAIIGAFTGVSCGPFSDIHEYVEKILERPVWTHEMGQTEVWLEIKAAAREDFLSICHEPET